MKNPITSTKHLKQGSLAEIMSYYMLKSHTKQTEFIEKAALNEGKKAHLREEYNRVYGYTPSVDLLEFEEAFPAYDEFSHSISEVWMMESVISNVSSIAREPDLPNLLDDWSFTITLLTGLERFGRDGCGDSCFVDTLPNPFQTSEVLVFDHETGKLSGYTAYSIADFISDYWGDSDDEKTDEEVKNIIADFNNEAKNTGEKRPHYHNPAELYKRTHWIMGHLTGKPTYAFSKYMADAPVFDDWLKEKSLLADEPVLANYWLLAHFFLNNTSSLEEAIEQANKSKSALTRTLATMIQEEHSHPGKRQWGRCTQDQLKKLKGETRKNCTPEMLEPEMREALLKERGQDSVKKLSEQNFKKLIADGMDPMHIIADYPFDVATHDRALEELGRRDEDFQETVDEYFEQRTEAAYNEWPYNEEDLDQRLSIPVSAAFRSGLIFDEDNEKSFSGISKTLGKLDDDHAMAAYQEAIKKLNPDDDRIESVIENLAESKHSQREKLLVLAANQTFIILDKIKENEEQQAKEREEEGYHLDNLFDVDNHFLKAVSLVLKWNNQASITLAHNILQHREERHLFDWALGDAFRVAGNNNLTEYCEFMEWYLSAVDGIECDSGSSIEDIDLYIFTEAVIAYTKLEPQKAKPLLEGMFEKDSGSKWFDMDVKSGILPGLLILDPDNENLHKWTKRLLGNRKNASRIRGALRAVAETKLQKARDWALYHLYSDYNNFMEEQFLIKILAREAMEALGEDAPDFDDDDEYANRLAKESPEKLIEGFYHPEKYNPKYICKRIIEKNIKSKEALDAIASYLTDLLYYSSDEEDTLDTQEALKVLSIQGPEAGDVCAELLKLEFLDDRYRAKIKKVMG